jgi:hypothetical protein
MISFLLWNLNKKDLVSSISQLVKAYDIDILILIELASEPSEILYALNNSGHGDLFYFPPSNCDHVKVFCKFPNEFTKKVNEDNRCTMRHIELPGIKDIILVASHFVSKMNNSSESQTSEMIEFASQIKKFESAVGHSRTVVAGDLNMNPFETGMVAANGLHGIMERNVVMKGSRTVQGRLFDFFYNPMWSFMGDATTGPAGTYYYNSAEMVNYFWNMFDQILIRPELLTSFENKNLEIITSIGKESLLTANGLPDKSNYSDHLPITFKLDL